MTATARLRGRTRWSAAARCPRWAACGLLGYEPAQPSDKQRGEWQRGLDVEERVAERIAEKYDGEIVRQKEVPWPNEGLPLGELHVDVFAVPDALAVEVKSTLHPDSILDSAIVQVAGAIRWDPDADAGAVLIASPLNNLVTDTVPVLLTDELRERVEELAEKVAHAGKTGTLPDCSCDTPGACRALGCPFTEHAWEGWERPDPVDVDSGQIIALVADAYVARLAYSAAKENADQAEQTYKDACAALLEAGLEPGVEYLAGPLKVKAIQVAASERFSYSRARKAGIWTPSDATRFAPFVTASGGHLRWTIERVSAERLPLDFGDEAPF